LHGATPQIIHRDLKPANILVDQNWNAKVCDFGLSQVKLPSTKIRDGKSIPGTPLWMAPEVLLGKDVDEKSDVYSFGIVLWEIVSGEDLWPEMDSFTAFREAVTDRGERPVIPDWVHPSLANLMQRCWGPDAKKRPSFVEIIEIIDSVLVDCLVSDPIANKFWKEKFLGKQTVPWSVFSSSFAKLLEVAIDSESTGWVCLKKIAAFPNNDPGEKENEVVNLEQFAHLINWFGPIPATKRENFVKGLKDLMKNEWFHGDIEKGESEDLLKNYKSGYFLVRTSKTTPDKPFTISKHSKKKIKLIIKELQKQSMELSLFLLLVKKKPKSLHKKMAI